MRECCQDEANLADPVAPNPDKPELVVRVCRECGARHFELTVDPGSLLADGQPL